MIGIILSGLLLRKGERWRHLSFAPTGSSVCSRLVNQPPESRPGISMIHLKHSTPYSGSLKLPSSLVCTSPGLRLSDHVTDWLTKSFSAESTAIKWDTYQHLSHSTTYSGRGIHLRGNSRFSGIREGICEQRANWVIHLGHPLGASTWGAPAPPSQFKPQHIISSSTSSHNAHLVQVQAQAQTQAQTQAA